MNKYVFIFLWLVSLDTITKLLAQSYFQQELYIIPPFLSLHYIQNTGIAFSIPVTWVVLKILTLVLIFGIFWYYWKQEKWRKSTLLNIWYTLIFAGAIWNAWERIGRGYVTDFISLEYFAVFNFADSYITLGACIILYFYFINT